MMKNPQLFPMLLCCACLLLSTRALAQKSEIERVEPPFWWSGMKSSKLQLLIQGENIAEADVSLQKADGVSISNVVQGDSPNFLFVDLKLSASLRPGTIEIILKKDNKKLTTIPYQFLARSWETSGVDQTDVIYLVTPDRFANGNTDNDNIEGYSDTLNRAHYNGRHGGDLEGVISKLDYMKDLGMTTLWLNPVLENAMPGSSYHGYAITDYYEVDPRYGSNELYLELSDELHKRDMKLVMDMVFNHCGDQHWWMKDMPLENWIHYYPDFQITNHAKGSIPDPYGMDEDRDLMEKGWFVESMPDLNQDNDFLKNYLIQNSIWWIEYANLDGIRMDTHPYNQADMMQEWGERVLREYPDFYMVGETWIADEAQIAYWAPQKDTIGFNSGLTSITDFPLCEAIHHAFKEGGDIYKVYEVLSKDYVYDLPVANKIFADNHDMDRFYHIIGEDMYRFKNAMTLLLTTRGIPQIYYGSEILMRKYGEHGVLREDFPGGWPGDERDAFTSAGRTTEENEAFDHMQKLLTWRRTSNAISEGRLKHYVPYENVYVYGLNSLNEKVVIIMNNNSNEKTIDLTRFEELIGDDQIGLDLLSGEQVTLHDKLSIPANSSLLLQLSAIKQ